ncbi:MAG: hypothetical protein VB031_02300 [Eubacteriaceae bacterium]|nr:hypothetical protein [Eubacteriaceae bacterium]
MRSNDEIKENPYLNISHMDERGGFGWINLTETKIKNVSVVWGREEGGHGEVEHVSVCPSNRDPSWDDMCRVKNVFFTPEEEAIQFHPPESEYVNKMKHCLHLWRFKEGRVDNLIGRRP